MNEIESVGRAFTWSIMGAEAIQAIQDLRWMLLLCVLLIIADFRFGMMESRKRYRDAVAQDNETLAKMNEFHFSRALRRTCNKFVDYMTLLLLFCVLGMAITEPYGLCSHVISAGVAVIIACVCELCSIFGHFFAIRGIKAPEITWKSVLVFLGRFAAGFAKTKDEDLGNALNDTIEQTLNEKEKTEETKES